MGFAMLNPSYELLLRATTSYELRATSYELQALHITVASQLAPRWLRKTLFTLLFGIHVFDAQWPPSRKHIKHSRLHL
jgi:hypothetical protein